MKQNVMLILIILCVVHLSAAEENNHEVVGWRYDGTGSFPDAKPVTSWSTTENVIWKTPLEKWANASPVVLKDRIFVTEEPGALVCVSVSDGSVMWRKKLEFKDLFGEDQKAAYDEAQAKAKVIRGKMNEVNKPLRELGRKLRKDRNNPELKAQVDKLRKELSDLTKELDPYLEYLPPKTHNVNGYASNTPVTDGEMVYVFYGSKVVAAYDMDGNLKWKRRLEGDKDNHGWGISSSLALVDGKVIAHVGKMYALDAETGEIRWETSTRIGWGTPIPADIDGLKIIISDSGEILKASDGSKLTQRPLNPLEFNSPLYQDGVVYFIQGNSIAYRLKRDGDNLVTEPLWRAKIKKDRYYASPLFHNGLIYDITQAGVLSVLDAADGKLVYTQNLKFSRGQVYPSVTLLGGKIFFGNEGGTVFIIEPGKEYKETAKFQFEKFRSTPVAIGNRIYFRTLENLYCIGKK